MKQNIVLMVMLGLAILLPVRGWANPLTTMEEHMTKVKYYEDQAKAQDAIVAEHQKMKKDYEKEVGFTPKWRRFYAGKISAMKKHCDVIIDNASKVANEFREMAKWHKMRAKELQGQ